MDPEGPPTRGPRTTQTAILGGGAARTTPQAPEQTKTLSIAALHAPARAAEAVLARAERVPGEAPTPA